MLYVYYTYSYGGRVQDDLEGGMPVAAPSRMARTENT